MIIIYFLSLSISFYLSTPEKTPMRVGSGTTENTPIVGRNASKHPYSPAGALNTPISGFQVVQHLAENRPISLPFQFQPSHPGKVVGKSPPPRGVMGLCLICKGSNHSWVCDTGFYERWNRGMVLNKDVEYCDITP